MEVRHVLIEVEVDTSLTQDQLEHTVSEALKHSTATEAITEALHAADEDATFMGWWVKDLLPWKEAVSVYDSDGPDEEVEFHYQGHDFLVRPTNKSGVHSGRTRYYVKCLTCGEVIHEATTGPRPMLRKHVKET